MTKYSVDQKEFRKQETLKAARIFEVYCAKRHLTEYEGARLIGVCQNTYSKWKCGIACASEKAVRRIMELVMADFPSLLDDEDFDFNVPSSPLATAAYPVLNLRKAVDALSQRMESPVMYATKNAMRKEFFSGGVKGRDLAIEATGASITYYEPKSVTTFLVQPNANIAEGDEVLVVMNKDDEIRWGHVFVSKNREQLLFKDQTAPGGKLLFDLPYYTNAVLGVYLIKEIHINHKKLK